MLNQLWHLLKRFPYVIFCHAILNIVSVGHVEKPLGVYRFVETFYHQNPLGFENKEFIMAHYNL